MEGSVRLSICCSHTASQEQFIRPTTHLAGLLLRTQSSAVSELGAILTNINRFARFFDDNHFSALDLWLCRCDLLGKQTQIYK